MTMTGTDIRELVIVKLEERSAFLTTGNANNPILSGSNNLDELKPIYGYIDSQLPIAANEVLMSVPVHKLIPARDTTTTNVRDSVLIVELPSDFIRLHTIKLNGWEMPVHAAINAQNPLYRLQQNKYTRGIPQKPVVVYSEDGTKKELLCYTINLPSPLPTGYQYIDTFLYIKDFDVSGKYNSDVAELIALNCAKKILEVFGNTEQVSLITSEIQNVQTNMLL